MIVDLFHPRTYTLDCRCGHGTGAAHREDCLLGQVVSVEPEMVSDPAAVSQVVLTEAEYAAVRRLQSAGLLPAEPVMARPTARHPSKAASTGPDPVPSVLHPA